MTKLITGRNIQHGTHLCFLADIDHDPLRDWGHQPRPLGTALCNSGGGQILC